MGRLIIRGMKYEDEDTPITNGIYAHGELEKEWGYDLVWIPKWRFVVDVEEGIYDAWFILPNNEIVDAKVFVWKSNGYEYKHGLVVKVGDGEYMEDAQSKYNRKAEVI